MEARAALRGLQAHIGILEARECSQSICGFTDGLTGMRHLRWNKILGLDVDALKYFRVLVPLDDPETDEILASCKT